MWGGDSFCKAGAVFGEGGVRLFVALAACREILAWPERKKLYSSYRMRLADATSYVSEAAGARWRFLLSDHARIIFILAEPLHGFLAQILHLEFPGRRSAWWVWRVALLAPRIVNEFHMWRESIMSFILRGRCHVWWSWRVLLLPRALKMALHMWCRSIMRFICAAGAVFAEVGGWLCCSAHCRWRCQGSIMNATL